MAKAAALVLVPALAHATPYVFRQASFATAEGALPVASGDFNGDHHADAVFVAWDAGKVSLLLGSPDGAFSSGATIEVGEGAADAVATDVDGDSRLDLAVVVNSCPVNEPTCPAGHVAVLRGRGDGTFEAPVEVPTGRAPISLAAADLNGDGRLDLAVACEVSRLDSGASGAVFVHLGAGDGSFGEGHEFAAGAGVRQVLAVDVTGDGRRDLVVVNHPSLTAHELTLLPGNGDGTFAKPVAIDSLADPLHAAAGDLDGDGKQDLAVITGAPLDTNVAEGQLVFLRGKGDGTFEAKRVAVAWGPQRVAMADVNADQLPDLVVTAVTHGVPPLAGALSVLVNAGNGAFQAHREYTTGASSWLVTLDADEDGHTDALVTVADGATVVLGNGDGSFAHPVNVAAGHLPAALARAELDGNGTPDLVLANASCLQTPCPGSTLSALLGDGHGHFGAAKDGPAGDNPVAIATGDFNRDGHVDVATASLALGVVNVHLGNGDGTFHAGADVPVGEAPKGLAAADFDGDGTLDLAATSSAEGVVRVARGNGDGTFAPPRTFEAGSGASALHVFDANGDGMADLAVTNAATPASLREHGTISVLLGQGDGTFRAQVPAETASLSPRDVVSGDFDGDGRIDLAAATVLRELGRLVFLKGDGTGHFAMAEGAPLTGNTATAIVAADLDGNGRPDVAVANLGSNTVALYLSNTDGTFTRAATHGGGVGPAALVAGDLDGDGLPDLAIADMGDDRVSLLLTGCPGGLCPASAEVDAGTPSADAGSGPGPVTAPEGCGCGALAGTPALALLLLLRRRR